MSHRKYSSIDNHYQTKEIMKWLSAFPELANESFLLQEKIDGTNIQLYYDGDLKFGKRSTFLEPNESFFNVWETVKKYEDIVERMDVLFKRYKKPIRLYGEMYGIGIQKRINYDTPNGNEIRFFDLMIGDEWISQYYSSDYRELVRDKDVPVIDVVKGLENAVSYSRDFQSRLSSDPTEKGKAEGFVIKPVKPYVFSDGSRFVFKAKSDAFAEKMKVEPKERKAIPERVLEAYNAFNSYLTDNRIDNVIGNNGPLETPSQLGDYIRYVLEDMKKDFIKDGFDESEFEKEELKQIYNVGGKIVVLLKARL